MRSSLSRALLMFVCLMFPLTARADLVFSVTLSTSEEPTLAGPSISGCVPETAPECARPEPFGEAQFVFDGTNMTMLATIFNIDITGAQTPDDTNDNLTAAHVHVKPLATAATGPVRWGFFGMPDNDIDPNDLVVTPFASGVGGVFTSVWNTSEGQPRNAGNPSADPIDLMESLPSIIAGLAYLNFHTVQNPGGEIRGDLLLVSEPGTLALLLLAIGLMFIRRVRSQR